MLTTNLDKQQGPGNKAGEGGGGRAGHMSMHVHGQTCGKGGNREEDLKRGAWLLGAAEYACVEALTSVCSAVFVLA